jgi:hypothetical protein
MTQEMLVATQQAAWAAQSAAQAAWWALAVNGAVVAVAIGTTFFQEWRVSRRLANSQRSLHQGAVDTVRQGWIAMDEAAEVFHEAGWIDVEKVRKRLGRVDRARRLIALFVAREVDPKILIGLLQMDDHLTNANSVLTKAMITALNIQTENAAFNGEIDEAAASAKLIFISLA